MGGAVEDLKSRIESLTPDQRAQLARRLGERSIVSRLVAYVVPDENAPVLPDPAALRDYMKERLPEYMVPSAFVVLDALPRLPNGKVDFRRLPEPMEYRTSENGGFTAPRNEKEELLARIWADVLGYEHVGIHDNFFEIGGDSILSIQIIAKARRVGLRLTPAQMIQHQTIAGLSSVVEYKTAPRSVQNVAEGPAILTPIQHWFFEQPLQEPYYWNQMIWLEGPGDTSIDRVQEALRLVVRQHDALRLRFRKDDSGWHAWYASPDEQVAANMVDLSGIAEEDQVRLQEEHTARQQAGMDLANGPLIRATLFKRGDGRPSLLALSIHHILVDPVSWRTILEDFATAYDQLTLDESVDLSPPTTSYKQWSEMLTRYAQSDTVGSEREYWLVAGETITAHIPRDKPGVFAEASASTITMKLSADETNALLKDVPGYYNVQPEDVLLTALALTLYEWTGHPTHRIGLERHGREEIEEDVDLSRTVGWFTSFFPVVLSLASGFEPDQALKSIKEQLRAIPARGIGYGLLRYLRNDPTLAEVRLQSPPEVIFNYTGRVDVPGSERASFRPVGTLIAARSPQNKRANLIETNTYVLVNQLNVTWTYSEDVHEASTIERVSNRFTERLQGLITHCLSGEAVGYTPSDFPEAGLDQEALDRLLDRFVS